MQYSPHTLLSNALNGNQKDLPNIPLFVASKNLLQSIVDHMLGMIGYRGSRDMSSVLLVSSYLCGKSESTR
jgi:hypothetical protein